MKKNLKILLPFALVLFLLPAAAMAQGHRQRDPEKMLERMEAYLDLSATQKTALAPVFSEMMEKRQALIADLHEKARLAMTAMDAEEDAKLKEILTEDQMAAFRKLREERRERRAERHPGMGHPGMKTRPAMAE